MLTKQFLNESETENYKMYENLCSRTQRKMFKKIEID